VKLLIINPVGHNTWNEQDRKIYQSFDPTSEMSVVSLPKGPPSVETPKAHREVIPLIIDIAKRMYHDFDAIAVNCFLDPAVDTLKKTITKPVIAPCESSLALASITGTKIGVVTVHGQALSMIRHKVRRLDRHRKVKAIAGIPLGVLDLDKNPDQTKGRIVEESRRLQEKYRVDTICLGCTGLGGLARSVQEEVEISIVDPIGAVVGLARAAVDLGL
jgi:allantoin racemase